MSASSDARGGDQLTRTTLEADDGLSVLTLAGLLVALRRVPGVLLADLAADNRRAVVVHDGAVPSASLLAAAESAGVAVRIFRADRPSLASTVAVPFASTNGLLVIVADVALLCALVYLLNPRLFGAPAFLFMLLAAIAGGVAAGAILGRRK